MNYGKAVEEVWTWREAVAKDVQRIPRSERAKYTHDSAQAAAERLGLKCKIAEKTQAKAA